MGQGKSNRIWMGEVRKTLNNRGLEQARMTVSDTVDCIF